MFSSKNKIVLSYIDRNRILHPKIKLLNFPMAKGPWYFEKSNKHILGINNRYSVKNVKDFTMKLDNCDIDMFVNDEIENRNFFLDGKDEEYFCKVAYHLQQKEITYVRVDKNYHSRCFYNDENLKFTF